MPQAVCVSMEPWKISKFPNVGALALFVYITLNVPQVENYPRGFPKLACFLDSDDAFMVYKRFGIVFSRLLLDKQDQIRQMEARLHAMDHTDASNGGSRYLMSRNKDVARDPLSNPYGLLETRPQLLEALERKILEYCTVTDP